MRLTELIGAPYKAGPDPEIVGLTADSRCVAPGFLFAALPGVRADGRSFIADALKRGAAAVLAPPGVALGGGAALITDDDPRRRFALLAARFYGAQPETVAAVTGTNGKTSVAWFTHQIWRLLGHRAASLGTLGLKGDGGVAEPGLTTPDPAALHQMLAALAAARVDHLAIEASSHGLAQRRLDGVRLAAAGFTNISRDHFDYHGSLTAYREAKLRLFAEVLPEGATAVLNADAEAFEAFDGTAAGRGLARLTYGARGREIRIDRLTPRAEGQRIDMTLFGRRRSVELKLVGDFQAGNALCALGLAVACGDAAEIAADALAELEGAPGRLQRVAAHPNGAPIYVDYAHTPDALAHVLRALRPHTEGRLLVVFGCGGDRDAGKRPLMGQVVRELADMAWVTDDNPRSEPPAAIRAEILAACPDAVEIGDRAEAIRRAAGALRPGDVLVVAGKGHETGQIVGAERRPFDDAEAVRATVAAIEGRAA